MAPTVTAVRPTILSVYFFTHSIAQARTEAEMVTLHDPPGSVTGAGVAAEEIEMPFVPAPKRQQTTPAAADTIITVGQRNQQKKKRKRNPTSNRPEDEVEMFDYTAEPSLLDAGDIKQVGPMTKKRNKGKRVWSCTRVGSDTLARTGAGAVWKFPSTSKGAQSTQEWQPVAVVPLIRCRFLS